MKYVVLGISFVLAFSPAQGYADWHGQLPPHASSEAKAKMQQKLNEMSVSHYESDVDDSGYEVKSIKNGQCTELHFSHTGDFLYQNMCD